jgi:hypothetical protein
MAMPGHVVVDPCPDFGVGTGGPNATHERNGGTEVFLDHMDAAQVMCCDGQGIHTGLNSGTSTCSAKTMGNVCYNSQTAHEAVNYTAAVAVCENDGKRLCSYEEVVGLFMSSSTLGARDRKCCSAISYTSVGDMDTCGVGTSNAESGNGKIWTSTTMAELPAIERRAMDDLGGSVTPVAELPIVRNSLL